VTEDVQSEPLGETSRRLLVGGLLGLPVLAACGSGDGGDGSGGSGAEDGGSGSSSDQGTGGSGGSGALGKTSDVPVGGAKIYADQKVVVSQPTEGEFKAFSNVCTHRQCAITKLDGAEIECGCHGSRFKVEDGSVIDGPASDPLEERTVTVQGEDLVLS
jgi:nitrite reductase/ring-hydroxylating ferredoxin subunit